MHPDPAHNCTAHLEGLLVDNRSKGLFVFFISDYFIIQWNSYILFVCLFKQVGDEKKYLWLIILWLTTGWDEETLLRFKLHPTLVFTEVDNSFLPRANTCINAITFPTPSLNISLQSDKLFDFWDCAFLNGDFGNH